MKRDQHFSKRGSIDWLLYASPANVGKRRWSGKTNMAHVGQPGSVQNNIIYVIPDADEVLDALFYSRLLEIFEDEIELLGEDEDDFIVVIASAVGQLSQGISGVRITSYYYEETVPRYSDCTFRRAFRSHFRLSRSAFEKLLQFFEPSAEFTKTKNNNGGKDPVPIASSYSCFSGTTRIQKLCEPSLIDLIKWEAVSCHVYAE